MTSAPSTRSSNKTSPPSVSAHTHRGRSLARWARQAEAGFDTISTSTSPSSCRWKQLSLSSCRTARTSTSDASFALPRAREPITMAARAPPASSRARARPTTRARCGGASTPRSCRGRRSSAPNTGEIRAPRAPVGLTAGGLPRTWGCVIPASGGHVLGSPVGRSTAAPPRRQHWPSAGRSCSPPRGRLALDRGRRSRRRARGSPEDGQAPARARTRPGPWSRSSGCAPAAPIRGRARRAPGRRHGTRPARPGRRRSSGCGGEPCLYVDATRGRWPRRWAREGKAGPGQSRCPAGTVDPRTQRRALGNCSSRSFGRRGDEPLGFVVVRPWLSARRCWRARCGDSGVRDDSTARLQAVGAPPHERDRGELHRRPQRVARAGRSCTPA